MAAPIGRSGAASGVAINARPVETFPRSREIDRYLTADSDPSQEIAVMRARHQPGLLVEGPPGTGKSQTIVNMVADAIGRCETVLLVCQKVAALKVVQKRLVAEGLGERLIAVVDTNRDRESIVRALREHVPQVRRPVADRVASIKVDRRALAAPEAIIGAVSAASDWWSLGMIVLEQATAGACFADTNDKAFQIHVVTRGIDLPTDLDSPHIG